MLLEVYFITCIYIRVGDLTQCRELAWNASKILRSLPFFFSRDAHKWLFSPDKTPTDQGHDSI